MKVTLGGNRLGSGKKMDVEMHNFERSTHDLGNVFRSSMAPGTLVPCYRKILLPGDTWDIDLNAIVMTHPSLGPLFGSYKLQIDVFTSPIRLYQGKLHNNATKIGLNMQNVKLPLMTLAATKIPANVTDIDNCQINSSCLLSYLGIRGVGVVREAEEDEIALREFNALGLLTYWDIYKQYYSNKQEEIGAVVHTPILPIYEIEGLYRIDPAPIVEIPQGQQYNNIVVLPTSVIRVESTNPIVLDQIIIWDGNVWTPLSNIVEIISTGATNADAKLKAGIAGWTFASWRYITRAETPQQAPGVATFPLEDIDHMRDAILAHATSTTPFMVSGQDLLPYSWILTHGTNEDPYTAYIFSQEGLGLKTFQSDLFNNWLDTEWIDGINSASAISTIGGSFTIDALNLANRVYNVLNRVAVSDGTYQSWTEANWGHKPFNMAENPIYHGGLIKEVVFEEVVSTADTGNGPLGTLAGKGTMAGKHKGGHVYIKADEISMLMIIVSLTPRIDYSQGNDFDVLLKTMNDFHMPGFDQIGFQNLMQDQMAWWTTVHAEGYDDWVRKSAGKQPAWINYMTSVNKTYGSFAEVNNEMFMTLNRRYEWDDTPGNEGYIKDLTTYIDPSKFNFIWAETAIDAQNFWVQVQIDAIARRKMSAKVIPNL